MQLIYRITTRTRLKAARLLDLELSWSSQLTSGLYLDKELIDLLVRTCRQIPVAKLRTLLFVPVLINNSIIVRAYSGNISIITYIY